MADRNVNIQLTATDLTGKAIASASSGLASLGKLAIGTAAGFGLYNGVSALFGGITKSVFGMNNSLDATGRQAATMLESIRTSTVSAGGAITATAKQTENWGRQLREIREREAQGFADFAQKTRDLNDQLNELLSGSTIQKRARDERQTLADLAKDHADRVADLQAELNDAQNEGLVVDGVIYRQANEKKIADLTRRIAKEDRDYQDQLDRRKREYDEDLSELQTANNKRIAEVRRALEETKRDEIRFTRDIKEAYGDLEAAKRLALSSGGGASGGLAEGTGAVITYRQELQKLGKTGAQIFGEFQKFFREEGVRSPFNVADIQAAGAQLAQYSGGNLANMQKIVRMAEALASSPAVQQFSASERLQLGIRALSEAYNGQYQSLREIFNIAGPTFDALKIGTYTTTQFADQLNAALESAGVNYDLVAANSQTLDGAWGNLIETGNLLLANISSPIYAAFRDELVRINDWVTANQGAINRWADDMKNRLAGFIASDVMPRFRELQKWIGDYFTSGKWRGDLDHFMIGMQNIGNAVMTVVGAINAMKDAWDRNQKAIKPFLDAANTIYNFSPAGIINNAASAGLKKLFGYADGTAYHPGGMAVVGERGPELVNLPRGSQVFTNDESRRMVSGGGPTVQIENFHAHNDIDLTAFARELSWKLN